MDNFSDPVAKLRRETRSAWQANNDMANASRNYRIDLPKVKRNPNSPIARVFFWAQLTLWLMSCGALGAIIALGLLGYKLPLLGSYLCHKLMSIGAI